MLQDQAVSIPFEPLEKELNRFLAAHLTIGKAAELQWHYDELVDEHIPRPTGTEIVGPVEATPHFEAIRAFLGSELARQANERPAGEWLSHLRCFNPHHVFRRKSFEASARDAEIAETIASCSTFPQEADSPFAGDADAGFDHLLQFLFGVRALSDIESQIRWAGKGASFRLDGRAFPRVQISSAEFAAVQLFDQRVAANTLPMQRAGSIVLADVGEQDGDFVAAYSMPPRYGPIPVGEVPLLSVQRFAPRMFRLQPLSDLSRDRRVRLAQWINDDVVALLCLCRIAAGMMSENRVARYTVLKFGYIIVDKPALERELARYFPWCVRGIALSLPLSPPASPAELVARIESLRCATHPLTGGRPIIRWQDSIFIDVVALTAQLEYRIEYPSANVDEFQNARGAHWEDVVQAMIDDTPWRPSEVTRALRKELRLNAKVITDIDAIGEMNGVLLMVSCKSFQFTARHEIGDFRAVRNTAVRAVRAAIEWEDRVQKLRTHLVGDNYDLRRYRRIIEVACCPSPIYTPFGPATDFAEQGLRNVSTYLELKEWLCDSVL